MTTKNSAPGATNEGIEAFLANAALATDQDELKKDENAVKLMTVHAAKGLEFQHVFIAGLEQDLFPFKHVSDVEIDQSQEEEERRLFYVALTRAKDELYLTYPMMNPKSYTGDVFCRPSMFLEDFPATLVEEWNVGNEDPWAEDEPF